MLALPDVVVSCPDVVSVPGAENPVCSIGSILPYAIGLWVTALRLITYRLVGFDLFVTIWFERSLCPVWESCGPLTNPATC